MLLGSRDSSQCGRVGFVDHRRLSGIVDDTDARRRRRSQRCSQRDHRARSRRRAKEGKEGGGLEAKNEGSREGRHLGATGEDEDDERPRQRDRTKSGRD